MTHLSPFRLGLIIIIAIAFAIVVVGSVWGGVKMLNTKTAEGATDKTARTLGWLLLAFGVLAIGFFLDSWL